MMTKGHRAGGGIAGKNVTQKPVRTGAASNAVRPGFAGQIGSSVGTHITARREETNYRGVSMITGAGGFPSKLGNEIATNVGKGGPGAGRDVHSRGMQGQHGAVNRGAGRITDTKGQWPDTKR